MQRAFRECHALQCGFCTPGFLTTITAGLAELPDPTDADAVAMIAGNLCRCTGYQNIVGAVLRAAELSADAPEPTRRGRRRGRLMATRYFGRSVSGPRICG